MKRYKSLGLLVLLAASVVISAILAPFFFLLGFGMGMILLFFCAICIYGLFCKFVDSINQPLAIKK